MAQKPTRRPGRLCRYCVCRGASRRGGTCPLRPLAASTVEGLVLGQMRRLPAPEQVVRTITP